MYWTSVKSMAHCTLKTRQLFQTTFALYIILLLNLYFSSTLFPTRVFGYNAFVQQKRSGDIWMPRTSTICIRRGEQRRRNNELISMKIKVGIIGLPNVGKSTLFNALCQKSIAQAENFPFCTVDPNKAPVAIPDLNLERLGHFAHSTKCVPATIDFIDVAGLVKGASRGEGLGNQFLATIRECDALVHVVRCYEDDNIVHVDGSVEPLVDAEVVNMELLLADEAHVERRLDRMVSCVGEERATLERILEEIRKGVPARSLGLSSSAKLSIKSMGLLTLKPVIYAFNVDEIDFFWGRHEVEKKIRDLMSMIQHGDRILDLYSIVSAKVEAEVSKRSVDEQIQYLVNIGGLNDDVVSSGRELSSMDELLSYRTFPTLVCDLLNLGLLYTGPGVQPSTSQTTKAHIFHKNNPPTTFQLAGKLHGDIQKGFLRAEVSSANVLLSQASTYATAKDAGIIRTEGKDYKVETNDVILIKWR